IGAIVREVAARGQRDELDAAVALLGDAALAAQTDAVIVAAEHEVHHAGDGVRTVDRRAAARDHVDALDEVARDGVDVDQIVAGAGGDVAAAVDQHQGAGRAETAKIEDVEAGGADEAD